MNPAFADGRCFRHAFLAAVATLCLLQAVCASPRNDETGGGISLTVPMTDGAGHVRELAARVCRPLGAAPATLVLINHGSPADVSDRPRMRPGRCDLEAAQWFLDRGYVVGFVLRRGYGATGGSWDEGYGACDADGFVRAGIETARDMDAAVNAMTRLPFVRPDGVIIVGESAGGWGAIAYNSEPHPKVFAFVVMAGGRGGHYRGIPNNNCRPDMLVQAAGRFGSTATTPMLWIYAANDSFFAPPLARAMYDAFTEAGGKVDFQQTGPFGRDGHGLFYGRGASAIWGPMVERYLMELRERRAGVYLGIRSSSG